MIQEQQRNHAAVSVKGCEHSSGTSGMIQTNPKKKNGSSSNWIAFFSSLHVWDTSVRIWINRTSETHTCLG
jgi:hypothetical protein